MKRFLTALSVFMSFLFFFTLAVSAETQSTQSATTKIKITFPVLELGNCPDLKSCKTYCEGVTHKDVCIAFAKKQGFYKEPPVDEKKQGILNAAKTDLGCVSPDTCRALCALPENVTKCRTFGEKYHVAVIQKTTQENPTLQKAKEILGCTSAETCKQLCRDETNHEKCSQFAKQAGVPGGRKISGPGGCDSAENCKTFCTNHPAECLHFKEEVQKKERIMKNEHQATVSGERREIEKRPMPFQNEGRIGTREAQQNRTEKRAIPERTKESVQGVSTGNGVVNSILNFLFGR